MYVLRGSIVVSTEFYDPITLTEGQSIYIDSSMGHGYLAAAGCDEAEVLGVMASGDEELMQALISMHEDRARDEHTDRASAQSDIARVAGAEAKGRLPR